MRVVLLISCLSFSFLWAQDGFDSSFSCKGRDTLETWQGLRYCIIESTEGRTPEKGDRLYVEYKGYFSNGVVFDSSTSFNFRLQKLEVIRGWDIGFALLKEGESARFFVPWKLAYGKHGRPPMIPRKADLIFDVKLTRIKD